MTDTTAPAGGMTYPTMETRAMLWLGRIATGDDRDGSPEYAQWALDRMAELHRVAARGEAGPQENLDAARVAPSSVARTGIDESGGASSAVRPPQVAANAMAEPAEQPVVSGLVLSDHKDCAWQIRAAWFEGWKDRGLNMGITAEEAWESDWTVARKAVFRREVGEFVAPKAAPERGDATHFFNADDWEVTYEDADMVWDEAPEKKVIRMGRLHRMPDVFMAAIPVTFDDDGDVEDYEWREFATKEEAEAAKAAALPGGDE